MECTRCRTDKPDDSFAVDVRYKRGRKNWCKECSAGYHKEWSGKKKPEERRSLRRRYNRQHNFGIDEAALSRQIAEQGGMCAVCRKSVVTPRISHIDHCHATGRIRGVLCRKCNIGLGWFYDDHESLLRASGYVKNGGVWADGTN